MPRPNRYHPYARPQNSTTVASPHYPPLPSLHMPQAMPSISEPSVAMPYQSIHPGYIRGITRDGKTLIANQILQSADGTFHIQMKVVRFPSEEANKHNRMKQTQPIVMPLPTPPMVDLSPSSFCINTVEQPMTSDNSSNTPQDGRSVRSQSEECAVLSEEEDDDDVDAQGEEEDVAHMMAIMEQRKIMAELSRQRE